MQIEMIVRRQSENRDRVTYPGAFEPLATIRARCSNKDCADIFDGPPQIGIAAPKHDNPMPLQRAELLGRTERDCTTADDDHDRIARLCHRRLPHPSALSGSGG